VNDEAKVFTQCIQIADVMADDLDAEVSTTIDQASQAYALMAVPHILAVGIHLTRPSDYGSNTKAAFLAEAELIWDMISEAVQ